MAGLHSYEPYTPWASHEDPRQPWQVPQTRHGLGLPTGALTTPPRPVPCSTWASPLRVPLPDPINEKPFCEDTLDLPPHLSSIADQFSDLDPSWPQESQYYPPPGLAAEQPLACPEVEKKTPLDVDLPPGIKIFVYNGPELPPTRVEWRIDDLNGKLQASMGRPLVSPPFAALALPNLRLMVFPDGREQMKNARSSERKGLYTQMIKKGTGTGRFGNTSVFLVARFYQWALSCGLDSFSCVFGWHFKIGCVKTHAGWRSTARCVEAQGRLLAVCHGHDREPPSGRGPCRALGL